MLTIFHSEFCPVCKQLLEAIESLGLKSKFKYVDVYENEENYNKAVSLNVIHLPSFVSPTGQIVHYGIPSEDKIVELSKYD